MSGPIVVYGAGGHGREVAALVAARRAVGDEWDFRGFLSDDGSSVGHEVAGMPVLGGEDWLRKNPGTAVAMGIGSPADRSRVARRITPLVGSFPSLVHPSSVIMDRANLAQGVMVFAGSVVSVDVQIGEFAAVNVHVSVSHDCRLGRFATLAPRVALAGSTVIGEGADLGTGAVSIPGVRVGTWSVVGAGAVVIRDVPDHCTAIGVPARVIRNHAKLGSGSSDAPPLP